MPWALSGGRTVGRHTPAATPPGGTGPVSHGSELTIDHVGPWTLQGVAKGSESLWTPSISGQIRVDAPQWGNFPAGNLPTGTYTPSDSASNHGGYLASTTTIDGYSYPAGSYVLQFADVSVNYLYLTDFAAPFILRGCRWRGGATGVGVFNTQAGFTSGSVGAHYCDAGGLDDLDASYNEIPFKAWIGQSARAVRNYISYTSTGIQWSVATNTIAENYITNLVAFYGAAGPPSEGGEKHLNGCTFNGGQPGALVLRNNITLPSPLGRATVGDTPRAVVQTDAISFFQDFGMFPGTGTNDDGSTGYLVKDNYIGGGTYTLYAGKNADSLSDSVSNMVVTGNKFTTQWWSGSGSSGAVTAQPTWGTLGNAWSNNTWADGPNSGQTVT